MRLTHLGQVFVLEAEGARYLIGWGNKVQDDIFA